jgi:hypothetical protein
MPPNGSGTPETRPGLPPVDSTVPAGEQASSEADVVPPVEVVVPEQGSVEQAAQVSTNTFELPVVSTEAVGPPSPPPVEAAPSTPQAAPVEIGPPPAADPAQVEATLANMPRFEAPPAPEPAPLYDATVDESRHPRNVTTIYPQGPPPQQQ